MREPFTKLLFCLITAFAFGQDQNQTYLTSNPDRLLSVSNGVRNGYGSLQSFQAPRRTEGSPYLFDDWNQSARVYGKNGQMYMLKNINLNLRSQAFVTKIGQDSIFTFQFNEINYFEVLGKKYESLFTKNGRQIFELVVDNGNSRLLRAHTVKLIESSPDPMKNRPYDKYVQGENFYYQKGNDIVLMPLRKNKVLESFDLEKEQEKNLIRYVKDNDLSFGDEKDIVKMMTYISTL